MASFSNSNVFLDTATGKPAVLVRGADDVRIVANFFGVFAGPFAAPLAGPVVRVEDGVPAPTPPAAR